MKHGRTLGIGALSLLLAVYCIVYGLVTRNVAQTTAQLAMQPPTIVIDAGHGGEDGGAIGVTGIRESDLNLAVALRLEQLLALCGVSVYPIRSDDTAVYTSGETITEKKVSDLKQRVELVRGTTNPLLVSIHQNHFSESKYDGAQVFYAATDGSRELANLTQSLLREILDPGNQRQCKSASSVYLMEQIQCPGILVECGFLSNPEEEALLQDEVYQTKIACAVGCAVAQFLEEGNKLEV